MGHDIRAHFLERLRQCFEVQTIFGEYVLKIPCNLIKSARKARQKSLGLFRQPRQDFIQALHRRKNELFKNGLADNALELTHMFVQVRENVCVFSGFFRRLPCCAGLRHHVLGILQTRRLFGRFIQRRPCLRFRNDAVFDGIGRHLRIVGKQADSLAAFIAAIDEAVQMGHRFIERLVPEGRRVGGNRQAFLRKIGRLIHAIPQSLEFRRHAGHVRRKTGRYHARIAGNLIHLLLCHIGVIAHNLLKRSLLRRNFGIGFGAFFAKILELVHGKGCRNRRTDFLCQTAQFSERGLHRFR